MSLRSLLYTTALSALLAFGGCGKKESPTAPKVNHSPVIERIDANPSEPYTGERVSLECIAKDEDEGDTLFYDWRSNSDGIDNPYNRRIIWTSPSNPGNYSISVKVEDRQRESSTHSINLDVISRFDTILVAEDAYVEYCYADSVMQKLCPGWLDIYKYEHSDADSFMQNWLSQPHLKFNLRFNKEIKSAKIRLTIDEDRYNDQEGLICDIHEIREQWSSNSLTWRNQPDYNITPSLRFLIPTFEGTSKTFYISGNEITNLIKSWADQNYGFKMVPVQQGIQKYFYSLEGAREVNQVEYIPALIVEYE